MRFIYVDPGLRNNLGHHANACRAIVGELRRRGVETVVLGFARMQPELRDELGAVPHFRYFTYWISDGDPVCGWLNAFHLGSRSMTVDLARLAWLSPEDVIYFNSAQAAQFMGVVDWIREAAAGGPLPQMIMELGTEPGLDALPGENATVLAARDTRHDPRAVLYRFAALRTSEHDAALLHTAAYDAAVSRAYAILLQRPVAPLPLPLGPITARRKRSGGDSAVVAVLGDQRLEKGYHLLPGVARLLLDRKPGIRILAHNGRPGEMRDAQLAMRALAGTEPRLTIEERIADPRLWAALIDAADIILCPYDPTHFRFAYSAVAAEAVANGVPLVVPARTTLAALSEEYGGCGITFDRFEAPSIAEATIQAIDRLGDLAAKAHQAAAKWAERNGAANTVDGILRLAGKLNAAA